MIAIDLAHQVRERLASDIQVESVNKDGLVVYMPFIYDDGDQFSIHVSRSSSDQWVLTDEGDALKRVSELGFDYRNEANAERLKNLIEFYGVSGKDGELNLKADDEGLVNSLFTLTQTCLEATWLAKTPKARSQAERQNFSLKFERLVKKAVPKAHFDQDWYDPRHDPKQLYPIDIRLEGKKKQLFLFGVPNQSACMRATITCQHYRITDADFEAVAIYDHEEQITKRYADQLNEVVDKRFPRIGETNSITTFLRAKVA